MPAAPKATRYAWPVGAVLPNWRAGTVEDAAALAAARGTRVWQLSTPTDCFVSTNEIQNTDPDKLPGIVEIRVLYGPLAGQTMAYLTLPVGMGSRPVGIPMLGSVELLGVSWGGTHVAGELIVTPGIVHETAYKHGFFEIKNTYAGSNMRAMVGAAHGVSLKRDVLTFRAYHGSTPTAPSLLLAGNVADTDGYWRCGDLVVGDEICYHYRF